MIKKTCDGCGKDISVLQFEKQGSIRLDYSDVNKPYYGSGIVLHLCENCYRNMAKAISKTLKRGK